MEVALGATFLSGPGFSVARLPSAAATLNLTSVKGTQARLFKIVGKNGSAGDRFLKLYNKATAPVVATDVPVMTIPLVAGQSFNIDFLYGLGFSAGLSYALTALAADTDATSLAAADVVGLNLLYL